ncbi:ABC transporter substrate-binding protein [Frankia sp. AiPs1]|uniref:ABC transporter substrate-binding protein n=1 Tax=Frankia sp. AiPa1 TaxID=573492 RepID=UPI00202B2018|nr:ABC transporter substrate-binding protein [Frankia sp. AiPa1]MCL9760560.1 ABC transporter substrate-binding protein [Frankia sp. AiPa1]
MTTRALSAVSALFLFLCLASLAACRSGAATSQSAACASAPGVTPNEVRTGYIYPETGSLAETFASVRAGLDARIDLANASGGVFGRQIRYDWEDDRGLLDTNRVVSQRLVENRNDFGIVEVSTAASGGAAYLASKGVPVVGIAIESVWAQYRNMFSFSYSQIPTSSDETVTTLGQYAKAHGGSRVLAITNPAGLSLMDSIAGQVRDSYESAGISVYSAAADEVPSQDQINGIIRQIAANHTDILQIMVSTHAAAPIVAALRQRGVNPGIILASGEAPDAQLMDQYGSLLAGLTIYNGPTLDLSQPAAKTYLSALARFAPELQDTSQSTALTGYIIGDMLVRGLQAAGPCPTRQSFINGLRAVRNYTAGGLTAEINFDADFGKSPTCYTFLSVNATGTGLTTTARDYCGSRVPKRGN